MLVKYLGIEADQPVPVEEGAAEAGARATVCAFRMEPQR
jgi:hypothetical protein